MLHRYRPRHAHRGRYSRPRRSPFRRLAAIATATVVFAAGCSSADDEPASDYSYEPSTRTVLYELEGTTDWASVTLATPTGAEQFNPDVPLMRKSGERGLEVTYSPGDFVYISAQNKRGHGTISCRITVDGVVISENESRGGYAIATCEGSA